MKTFIVFEKIFREFFSRSRWRYPSRTLCNYFCRFF